ncbi:MAG: hypothetical protein JJ992_27160, partial [Planctomycetes bacterium]|nr:hypothetical protein [Planctomycetota bacterium]
MPVWISDDADLLELEIFSSRAASATTDEIILNIESTVSEKALSRRLPPFAKNGKSSVREQIPVARFAGETCII